MIVLKWLLAMLLTSVPFVFHYCIKPKAASSDKWRNLYSFLSARMPWLKRKALAVKAWISYVYHKMYRSDNGRKFFTLVLVICMLVFQVVDFHAAKEACSRDEKQVAQLVKAWGWSRPAVLAFVDQLQKYEILEVCNMVTSKVVHLKPSIFSSWLSPTPGG